MKGTHLGEFEELVLLTVGILNGEAYGISVMDEIEKHTERRVSISTIHTTLSRLEKKGFIESYIGGASATRGGRSKRLYKINMEGSRALEKARTQRDKLWNLLPKNLFGYE
ncbi:MAG: PadR family transcriptional regulator [Bacteroidota bacterium]